jgi:hypothetical protein
MYVIYDKDTAKYYTGISWDASIKAALQMTKLRAEEMLESMKLKVSRGWESGDYIVIEVQ